MGAQFDENNFAVSNTSAPIGAPESSSGTNGVQISLSKFLAALGAALIIFGPPGAKYFGVAYLVFAIGLRVLSAYQTRFAHGAVRTAKTSVATRVGDWALRIGRHSRWWIALVGLLALGAAVSLRGMTPAAFTATYAVIALICAASAAFWSRAAGWSLFARIGAATGLAATVAMVWVVVAYGTNAWFLDEGVITGYVLGFPHRSWEKDLVETVAAHNGQHRIASTRLVALALYEIFGKIDFHVMAGISNLFLIGTVILAIRSLPKERRKLLYVAPCLLLLFQPQYYVLTLWGFSVQHFSVLFFAACIFVALNRGTMAGFVVAVAALIACSYSFGPGIFAGLIALAFLLDARRYAAAAYWSVPLALLAMRFFQGILLNALRVAEEGFHISAPSLPEKLSYLLKFFGSIATLGMYTELLGESTPSAEQLPANWIAQGLGVLFIALFLALSAVRYWRKNTTVYGLLLFTFLCGALAANQRNAFIAPPYLSRYAFNSCFFSALLYLAVLDQWFDALRRRVAAVSMVAAIVCTGSFAVMLPRVESHSSNLRFAVLVTANSLYQGIKSNTDVLPFFSQEEYEAAVDSAAYELPETQALKRFQARSISLSDATLDGSIPLRLLSVGENHVSYTVCIGTAVGETSPAIDRAAVLLIDEGGRRAAYEAMPLDRIAVSHMALEAGLPEGTAYIAVIPKSNGLSQTASLSLVAVTQGTTRVSASQFALPTVHALPAKFAPAALPEVIHATTRCVQLVDAPRSQCKVNLNSVSRVVKLPTAYSVEVLVKPAASAPGRPVIIWALTGLSASREKTGVRLMLTGAAFTFERIAEGKWVEISRQPATPDAWNWIAVSVNGAATAQMGGAVDPATGQISPLRIAQPPAALGSTAFPSGKNIRVTVEADTDFPQARQAELREIRILDGVLTQSAVEAGWPAFSAP